MRDMLFRGKRVDNSEWVEGYYYKTNFFGSNAELCDFITVPYSDATNKSSNHIMVYPETVGQYTGLTDKNGTKIFEGDIIKTQLFYDRPYSKKRKGKQFLGVVEWKTNIFKGNEVYITQIYKSGWNVKFFEDFGKYVHSSWSVFWNCEIIGNIHDNPELLKGGANDEE